jgi:hypothetical protein
MERESMPTTSTTGVSLCAIGLSISFWVVVLVRSIDLGAENRPGLCSQGSHSVTHRWVPKYLQDSSRFYSGSSSFWKRFHRQYWLTFVSDPSYIGHHGIQQMILHTLDAERLDITLSLPISPFSWAFSVKPCQTTYRISRILYLQFSK